MDIFDNSKLAALLRTTVITTEQKETIVKALVVEIQMIFHLSSLIGSVRNNILKIREL